MPTLVAALTLAGLLKIAHLGLPHWHLAFWFTALVMAALFQTIGFSQALLNGLGTFLASWLNFFGRLTKLTTTCTAHCITLFWYLACWLYWVGGFGLILWCTG